MVNVIVLVVHLLRFIVVDRVRSDDTKELVNVATENSPLFITRPGSHGYRMSRRTRSVVYDGGDSKKKRGCRIEAAGQGPKISKSC